MFEFKTKSNMQTAHTKNKLFRSHKQTTFYTLQQINVRDDCTEKILWSWLYECLHQFFFFDILLQINLNANTSSNMQQTETSVYWRATIESNRIESHWKCHRLTLPQLMWETLRITYTYTTYRHKHIRVHRLWQSTAATLPIFF